MKIRLGRGASKIVEIKVIPFSALVTLRTFICKTVSLRKLSITSYPFGLKQFGKLHVVGHKLLRFDPRLKRGLWFLKSRFISKMTRENCIFLSTNRRYTISTAASSTAWQKPGRVRCNLQAKFSDMLTCLLELNCSTKSWPVLRWV